MNLFKTQASSKTPHYKNLSELGLKEDYEKMLQTNSSFLEKMWFQTEIQWEKCDFWAKKHRKNVKSWELFCLVILKMWKENIYEIY